jgi:asparagine synthase (glutamine-hydrolysing)
VLPFQRLPRPVQRGLAGAAITLTRRLGRGIRHGEALETAARSSIPYWGGAICFRGSLKRKVVRDQSIPDSLQLVERVWDEAERHNADLFQKMTYVELKQRLPELLLMRLDKIAMASSVEGREPFLDHHVVEFAMALPPDMKVREGSKKHVLKEAMTGILPDQIIHRPKQGFGTPMREWLQGEFGDQAQREVRSSALVERGLLDYDRIDELFAAHRAGRGDWSYHLWNVHNVSTWYDRWVARRPVAA